MTAAETPAEPTAQFTRYTSEKNLYGDIVRDQLRRGVQTFAAAGPAESPAPPPMPTDRTSPEPPHQEYPSVKRTPNDKPDLFPQDVLGRAAAKRPDNKPVRPRDGVQVASARMSFEELPAKLQETLKRSLSHPDEFWAGLGNSQRQTLATTFNRLDAMGLWKHVAKVTGERAQPEKPAIASEV